MGGEDSTSTIPTDGSGNSRFEKRLRVVSIVIISSLVALSGVGLLGVMSATTRAADGDYSLVVHYPAVARPGLAAAFWIDVTRDNTMLPRQVTLRIDSNYLDMFDDNSIEPLPVSSYETGESTWWTFDVPPDQKTLRVGLDVRVEPDVQWGREGTASMEVDGADVVTASFRTWVMP